MRSRSELHAILVGILGSDKVYFQPPQNTKIVYPCIIYKRDDIETKYAGNKPYNNVQRYSVTYISRDPDDPKAKKLAELPMCAFDRFYTADNLNHDVYNLFF